MTQWTKETENYIYQLRTKLTEAQTGKKKLKQSAKWGISNENKTKKYVERKGNFKKKE